MNWTLVNLEWLESFSFLVIPLVSDLQVPTFHEKSFRFFQFWAEDEAFLPLVHSAWQQRQRRQGNCLLRILLRMQVLKKGLKQLKEDKYGSIS